MKNKKTLTLIIISFIIIFGTILFTKPKQVVTINLNYLSKADDNSKFMYDLTYVYRTISTFVKKYYTTNITQGEHNLNTYNVYEKELSFIKDVYEDIEKLFHYTRPSKISDLLANFKLEDNEYEIDQDQFQKIKDYLSKFTYKISEKKFLDPRTGKIMGSSIKIRFKSNINIDKEESKILGKILEKHITNSFLKKFDTRVGQIYNIAEDQIYNALMEKAEMYRVFNENTENRKTTPLNDMLIEEVKFDYNKMKKLYEKYNQLDEKYNKNLNLVEYDNIIISNYRGSLPQNYFFALLLGFFFFINIIYAFIINKKFVLFIKKIIT
jgi:hypothetical protein